MKNPLITMSAITGKPDKERIFKYLTSLKENGIGGAMLYPRSGCEIDYLSEEWFSTIGNFLSAAKEIGIDIWLYDDFNWPSGDAGGRVTKIEKFRLKGIKIKGDKKGEITHKSVHNSGLFGEKYFPDLLSCEAVDYFISLTHEEYFKRFSSYFGTVIKGMFTDEPSVGYCAEGDSAPYYDGMYSDYKNRYNRDLKEDIESDREDLTENITELVFEKFRDSYLNKIRTWCESHNILMTGHLMCDNDPSGAAKHSGSFLKSLKAFSVPGIDEIYSRFDDITEPALFGAIEYADTKNGRMAELFALGPSDMTYQKRRAMIYLCAAFKVDRYFLAVSHMDMRGNLKVVDYFNNFSVDQPDFSGMKVFSKEAENASRLASLDYCADVYVRYPNKVAIKSVYQRKWLGNFHKMLNDLTYKGIQWKFIDDESPTDAPIIELDKNFELTLNGAPLDISMLDGIEILNADKTPAKGIFVRKYKDGSLLIINLFSKEGEYLIDKKRVYLFEHDVKFSLDETDEIKTPVECEFSVIYHNENLIRTMHVNNEEKAEIYVNSDTYATIFSRNGTEITLNGEKISCAEEAIFLSFGMRDLYKMSKPVLLKKGKNVLCTSDDFKYLPSTLLMGDFLAKSQGGEVSSLTLSKRRTTYRAGDILNDFGKVELFARVKIPTDAEKILLEGACLFTKVYLDDILLGEKIATPYEFEIPKEQKGGEHILKIVQYSSMGGIFGDLSYWDEHTKNVAWRATPSPSDKSYGFEKIYFIKNGEK